ncbi:2-amino-4-hydroxy-6-hydroxymethyldihydropteridine diphosphokinase [Fluviispira vulneris]|uniref:2-amino-4-hydroxy-6- hydroxymethyldihydropteridine diphosphokinase n=1 Tax=Fluviispira vulneris TaxID=2763012 RepID=UPI001648B0EC|nr:2-amino-4-hydroxy-6-hydroxymethyldihydropteridine diphosphokinase [Fluviispira vulneris]
MKSSNKLAFKYILAFGSNLGDRRKNFHNAIELLNKKIKIISQTEWIETKPLVHTLYKTDDHENYLNFVCLVESDLQPDELYNIIVEIENFLGHSRERRWMPRNLDIDLLFCARNDSQEFADCTPFPFKKAPDFSVPHVDYFNRNFWRELVENDLKINEATLLRHHKTELF